MKILLARNKGVTNTQYKWVKDTITDYLENKFPRKGWIEPYHVEFEDIDIDVDVLHKEYSQNSKGQLAFGSSNMKDYFRTFVPRNTYSAVIHIYDNNFKPKNGYVAPFTTYSGIYNETGYIEIPNTHYKSGGLTPIHEMIHLFHWIGEKLGLVEAKDDQMDISIVNGVAKPYYKNDDATAKGGNYDLSIRPLKDIMSRLTELVTKFDALQKLYEYYLNIEKVVIPEKPKYKYFTELEVAGLNADFVSLLDKARGIAGIPFVINSGYRSPAYNKSIGGVKDSAHISGLAVDLRANNGAEAYAIIKSAIEVGIKRIGINRKKNFIHLDIQYTKPTPTIYEY